MARNRTADLTERSGSKIDTVMDFFDILMHTFATYMNQRYNITEKIEEMKNETIDTLYSFKRAVMRSIIEMTLLTTAVLALVAGIVILLSRFIPIEYVFIVYGIIILLVVLYTTKMRP